MNGYDEIVAQVLLASK